MRHPYPGQEGDPVSTPGEMWERYRALLAHDDDLGFRLDVSRMGLSPVDLAAAAPAMGAAYDAMEALEAGAVANPTEGRRVGHYWLRAPERAPDPEIAAAILATRDRVRAFAADVHRGAVRPPHGASFSDVLLIGIGGSALGPQLLADALGSPADRMRVHFLDNTDPDGIDRVLGRLGRGLATTLSIVVSKSGTTPETRNGMHETAAAYRSLGLDFAPHAVAVTQEGSVLDRDAGAQGFLARFPMWDWVGGRTSVTSAVGLLPAALQGIDVAAFLDGAAAMDRWTRGRDTARNPAALLALAWRHAGAGRGERAMVVLPYKDRLALFSRYLQQLVMESLGKQHGLDGRVVHQGLTVYGNKGSTDQHAYVQQLRDGRADFFATFIEVQTERGRDSIDVEPGLTSGDFLHGFLLGTRRALFESGRPSLTLTLRELTPRTLGALVALYERAVGFYAALVAVNAYDQPGVEAGKNAAAAVLELQGRVLSALRRRGASGGTCRELADDAGAADEVETVFHLLERLATGGHRRVERRPGATLFDAVYRLVSS
jgi:glucose-6-phosphate isomerase